MLGNNPIVQFENVGLRYGVGPEVLRDVSFALDAGSFHFLVGFFSFLSWAFYVKFINVEPTVWCYECNRYVLESSSGHQLEPLEK